MPGDQIRDAAFRALTVLTVKRDPAPRIVHNLEVAGAHTYFAGELEAWGHNMRVPKRWSPFSPSDPRIRSGCDSFAQQVQDMIGGDIKEISPTGGPVLGGLSGASGYPSQWAYHVVVEKGGRIFDALTGCDGMDTEDYKNLWKYKDDIDWPF